MPGIVFALFSCCWTQSLNVITTATHHSYFINQKQSLDSRLQRTHRAERKKIAWVFDVLHKYWIGLEKKKNEKVDPKQGEPSICSSGFDWRLVIYNRPFACCYSALITTSATCKCPSVEAASVKNVSSVASQLFHAWENSIIHRGAAGTGLSGSQHVYTGGNCVLNIITVANDNQAQTGTVVEC